MSETPQKKAGTGRSQPKAKRTNSAWKSALMASGVGGVILGWALLTQVDAPKSAQAQATAPDPLASQPAAATLPSRNDNGLNVQGQLPLTGSDSGSTLRGQAQPNVQSNPNRNRSLPQQQQPRFQRPLTRSRGS
jgi:hypothetical protein